MVLHWRKRLAQLAGVALIATVSLATTSPPAAHADGTGACAGLASTEKTLCEITYDAMDAANSLLPQSQIHHYSPSADADAWNATTALGTSASYSAYTTGWQKGVDYLDIDIEAAKEGIAFFMAHLNDPTIPDAAERLATGQAWLPVLEAARPTAVSNAQVAANRVVLAAYADVTIVDGKAVVTAKAGSGFVVSVVEGSETTTTDGKLQVTITVSDPTGQTAPVTFTWTQGADQYVKYEYVDPTPVSQSLSGASVSASDQVWTGGQVRPLVQVTLNGAALASGTAYTVSYGTNKSIGKGSVTVTGAGNYTGSKTVSFQIVPRATKVTKTKAHPKAAKVYVTKASKAEKVTKAQVQYRPAGTSAWKTKTFSAKAGSVKVKGLKKRGVYEFRTAVYKSVGGTRYYSAWSTIKAKKVK